MKKVIVLAAVLALFAAPAFAAIATTKHDLRQSGSNTYAGTSDELCVYCHTPHGGDTSQNAPLWNRDISGVSIASIYNQSVSGTMNANPGVADLAETDALLCMSCHDGSNLTVGLRNAPNSGGDNPSSNIAAASDTNLGGGLNNDHPVAFNYTGTTLDAGLKDNPAGVKFFNSALGTTTMWCSSCHNVHDNTASPFLRSTNAGSALCLACHDK